MAKKCPSGIWTTATALLIRPLSPCPTKSQLEEHIMAHKKIERMKEMDRRRKRRAERLKERIREAKAAAAKK